MRGLRSRRLQATEKSQPYDVRFLFYLSRMSQSHSSSDNSTLINRPEGPSQVLGGT